MRIVLENVTKRFTNVTAIDNMTLEINDGEMLALLGPSGCGKSTTLFAICGLHRIDEGRILFDDQNVASIAPQHRNVGVVFQSYALYPHLTVFDNIGFPLSVRKEKANVIQEEVKEMAHMLQINNLLDRLPGQLSGGQQQRVALARALIRKPDVLLMDEPLANLDAKLRLEMRSEIRRLQQDQGISTILVTHDQVEAMSMCDRIAIMDQGVVHQISTPSEMYKQPVNVFVAGFLGNPPICFIDGTIEGGKFCIPHTDISLDIPSHLTSIENGVPVKLGIRPEFLQPGLKNEVKGKITFIETQGREKLYDITLSSGDILRSIQPEDSIFNLSSEVTWGLKTDRILVFDEQGNRL
jgi:inositol-phosphate transport system ATP-binding protein